MRFTVSEDGEGINENNVKVYDTPERIEGGLEIFKKVKSYFGISDINIVSGGIAGTFNKEKSRLLSSPNLEGWVDKSFKSQLADIFDSKVLLENDAVVAGMGESSFGAGKPYEIVAYVTIGTGVGGAKIVNDKPAPRLYGFEPGHQIIVVGGDKCSCGGRGHLEAYVSGSSIEKRYNKLAKNLDDEEYSQILDWLTDGFNNLMYLWSPEVIVLGGGVIADDAFDLSDIKNKLKKKNTMFPEVPEIKSADLEDNSGLYGALAYCKIHKT